MEHPIEKVLSQAFTDGASDSMWQNDRHVEIYATALTAIYEIGLGVIGENVKEYPNDGAAQYGQRIGYNRAKDEFRLAWAKACGVE